MGVISGEMLVDGKQRDESFQRKTGYVQQQDLHLETSTVREALRFSAVLRQPREVPETEKIAYVEEVIKLLDMQEYADAVVGVAGEGRPFSQVSRVPANQLLQVSMSNSVNDLPSALSLLRVLSSYSFSTSPPLAWIHKPPGPS